MMLSGAALSGSPTLDSFTTTRDVQFRAQASALLANHPSDLLFPGPLWNGSAGSGSTPPAESSTPLGSGTTAKAIAGFDEPPMMYLTKRTQITVVCDTSDAAWISNVQFWLEGRTFTQSAQTLSSRTGAIGFACTLDFKHFQQDGDANLYAYVNPVNGLQRRIGPIKVTAIGTGVSPITRPVRYLSPTGNDQWDGTQPTLQGGTVGPWKTFDHAHTAAPSGAIVYCATGTYREDVETGTAVSFARLVTFKAASGRLGDVVVSRTTPGTPHVYWRVQGGNVAYEKIQVDSSTIYQFFGVANGVYIWKNCAVIDPNGPRGGPEGYWTNFVIEPFFTNTSHQNNAILESTLSMLLPPGALLYRNVNIVAGSDSMFLTNTAGGTTVINTTSLQTAPEGQQRHHQELSLTITGVTYDSVNNRTTINWTGTTTLTNIAINQSDPSFNVHFLSGGLVGQEFMIYGQTSSPASTTVYGNASGAAVNDTGYSYHNIHPDGLQLAIQTQANQNIENVIFQRYHEISDNQQPMFLQAGSYNGAGTITVDAAGNGTCSTNHLLQVNDFVRLASGSPQAGEWQQVTAVPSSTTFTLAAGFSQPQTSRTWLQAKSINNFAVQLSVLHHKSTTDFNQIQWQHGHNNVVMRQLTHTGTTGWAFRNALNNAFAAKASVIRDSIIASMTSDITPFPSAGLTIDNNHFQSGTARGTNSSLGAVTFDGLYKPTGVTRTCTPKLHWDHWGRPLKLDGTDLIGAVG